MKNKKLTLFVSVLLILTLAACNLPGGGDDVPDLALTITAQVLLNNQQQPGAPAEQATATPEFTATPGATATPESTATSGIPMVTVSINTNCRTGPGVVYGIVGALTVGIQAQIVGKNSSVPNYWVINTPNGSGTCWLWAEYATVTGNTSGLQEFAVPPTPTPSPTPTLAFPAPVSNLDPGKTCVFINPQFLYQGVLKWDDKSDNEDGFNIYQNGILVTSVGKNVESYAYNIGAFPPGVLVKFAVESYNTAGQSAQKEVSFTCP